jgi:hypothetical protein
MDMDDNPVYVCVCVCVCVRVCVCVCAITDINNVMQLQEQLRGMQSKLDDVRNEKQTFEHKCKTLQDDRTQLQK